MVRRLLVVTYYFPPRPGVGSLRLRGLAKYLPQFGWEPVILTAELPNVPDPRFQVVQTPYPGDVSWWIKRALHMRPEAGFQEQLGIPRAVRGSRHSLTSRLVAMTREGLAYPDEQKKWRRVALRYGHKLLADGGYSAILSSSGPVTCHLIAAELSRQHHVPWIADFRDLWTQNHYNRRSFLRRELERHLEVRTISAASALVAVSQPAADMLAHLHEGKSTYAIPNGFDPSEVQTAALTGKFTVTYAGALYEGKRDPMPLLQAIRELAVEHIIDLSRVSVRFFGPKEYWLDQAIRKHGLEQAVIQHGIVSREAVLSAERESQVLLLLNWDDPKEGGTYTGKLFEYLAARRPILAVGGPRGVASDLLDTTQTGTHVSDSAALKELLNEWYQQYEKEGSVRYRGRIEEVNKWSHREMAKKYSRVLDRLCG